MIIGINCLIEMLGENNSPGIINSHHFLTSFLQITAITSEIFLNISIFKFQDALHCPVKKIATVRDDQHRPDEIVQSILQNLE
jgi:hypothetical protein